MHINSLFFLTGSRECLILLGIQIPGILAISSATILLQVGKLRPGVGAGCFKALQRRDRTFSFQSDFLL